MKISKAVNIFKIILAEAPHRMNIIFGVSVKIIDCRNIKNIVFIGRSAKLLKKMIWFVVLLGQVDVSHKYNAVA